MEAKRLAIDITKKRILVTADDNLLSGIQKMDISIDASKPNNPASVTIKYWKKNESSDPMNMEDVKTGMSSCTGPYSVPFDANKYTLVQSVVEILEDPLGEYDE